MAFQEAAEAWASQAGSSLAAHLWQGTVFAVFVILFARCLRGAPARLRYDLYLLASVKFLLPSSLLLACVSTLSWDPSFGLAGLLGSVFDFERVRAFFEEFVSVPAVGSGVAGTASGSALWLVVLVAWALPTLLLLASWKRRMLRFRISLENGTTIEDGDVFRRLQGLRARLRIRRSVSLILSGEVREPGVWGVVRPVVVLPESMPRHLDTAELDAVLLHELVHVQRWDNLVGHLHMVLRSIFWFHPLVWWLDRRLLAEREQACDERVVLVSGDADAYLRGLAKVLRFGVGARLAGVSAAGDSNLSRRIFRIRHRAPGAASPLHRLALLAAALLLGFSSLAAAPLCATSPSLTLKSPQELLAGLIGCTYSQSPATDSISFGSGSRSADPRQAAKRQVDEDCDEIVGRYL